MPYSYQSPSSAAGVAQSENQPSMGAEMKAPRGAPRTFILSYRRAAALQLRRKITTPR